MRSLVGPRGQADELEQLVDARPDLLARALADAQAEGDVLAHAHVGEGRIVLKDESDPALLGACPGHVIAIEQHRAGVRVPRVRR